MLYDICSACGDRLPKGLGDGEIVRCSGCGAMVRKPLQRRDVLINSALVAFLVVSILIFRLSCVGGASRAVVPHDSHPRYNVDWSAGVSPLFDLGDKGKHDPLAFENAIKQGATINTTNVYGLTPIHLLVAEHLRSNSDDDKKRKEILSLLIRKGGDVNAKSRMGQTPLHIAAESMDSDLVVFLLQHAADPDIRDARGNLPESYCTWGQSDVDIALTAARRARAAKHAPHSVPLLLAILADLFVRSVSIVAFILFWRKKNEILKGNTRRAARGMLLWLVFPILSATLASGFYVLWYRGAGYFTDSELLRRAYWISPYPLAILGVILGMLAHFKLNNISCQQAKSLSSSKYDGGYKTNIYKIMEGSGAVALETAELATILLVCFALQAVCLLFSGIAVWMISA